MSYKEFKKNLKKIGFKKNNSKSKRISKMLKKEVFSTNTVILEIWFDENIFSKMVLRAQLNNMYGGLLIIK